MGFFAIFSALKLGFFSKSHSPLRPVTPPFCTPDRDDIRKEHRCSAKKSATSEEVMLDKCDYASKSRFNLDRHKNSADKTGTSYKLKELMWELYTTMVR